MYTCYFFGSPCYGHFNVTKNIVKELIRKGDQVVYYSEQSFRREIEALGAQFRCYQVDYDEIPTAITLQNISLSNLPRLSELIGVVNYSIEENIARYNKVIHEVRRSPPDYILFDTFNICGKLIAKELSIPCVTTFPIFVFNREIAESDPALFTDYFLLMGNDPLFTHNKNSKNMHAFLRQCDILVKKKYGAYIDSIFDAINCCSDTNIVFTTKTLQPQSSHIADTFHFVGCSIPDEEQSPLRRQQKGIPQIYISLGTTYVNQQLDFYNKCIAVFRKHQNWHATFSIGVNLSPDELGDIPDNCIIYNTANQLKELQIADLFITHGGANSANESLYYGVPMLIFPMAGDQFIVGKQIETLKCGKMLQHDASSPDIESQIISILDDTFYRHQCHILANELRSLGGYKKAVDIIWKKVHN